MTIAKYVKHERATLSWCLADPSGWDFCGSRFAAQDFEVPQHRALWEAIERCQAKRKRSGLSDVLGMLDTLGWSDEVGGDAYVRELYDAFVGIATQKEFASKFLGIKRRNAYFHALVSEAKRVMGDGDPNELVETSIARLTEAAKSANQDSALVPIAECVAEAVQRTQDIHQGKISKGVPSGIARLDDMTSFFQGGDFIVIGARPSVGKTAFAGTTILAAASRDVPSAFFSLEMDRAAVGYRFLAAESGLDLKDLRDGRVHQGSSLAFQQASEAVSRLPVEVFAGSRSSASDVDIGSLRTLARGFRQKHASAKQGIVVIDYLQLISAMATDVRKRHELIGDFSRGLKRLALELGWPVVALAQLNRDSDNRERPRLSDLRESGSIEQDADVVILIHRPHKDGGTTTQKTTKASRFDDAVRGGQGQVEAGDPNETELIVAKNRNGPIGIVPAYYQAHSALFVGR